MRVRISPTGHPTERMIQRGITRADIEKAVNNAHTTQPGHNGGKCFIGPGIDGRDLQVWVLPHAPGADVVTMKSAAWRDS